MSSALLFFDKFNTINEKNPVLHTWHSNGVLLTTEWSPVQTDASFGCIHPCLSKHGSLKIRSALRDML